jgi:ribosome-binding protein aMBF1 (putative translation factor)
LGVKLFERVESEEIHSDRKESDAVTLGDIAKVKWGK